MAYVKLLMLFALTACASGAHADDGFLSTDEGVETVSRLAVQIGNLIGLLLFGNGLYAVHKRSTDPNHYSVSYCLWNCIAGTLLLISATAYSWTVNSSSEAAWATDSTMLSVGSKLDDDLGAAQSGFLGAYLPAGSIKTLMGAIFIIGLISYLRGLYLLKNTGSMDHHSGGFPRAFWHISGGVAVMNILKVGCFFGWLLGISVLCSG